MHKILNNNALETSTIWDLFLILIKILHWYGHEFWKKGVHKTGIKEYDISKENLTTSQISTFQQNEESYYSLHLSN